MDPDDTEEMTSSVDNESSDEDEMSTNETMEDLNSAFNKYFDVLEGVFKMEYDKSLPRGDTFEFSSQITVREKETNAKSTTDLNDLTMFGEDSSSERGVYLESDSFIRYMYYINDGESPVKMNSFSLSVIMRDDGTLRKDMIVSTLPQRIAQKVLNSRAGRRRGGRQPVMKSDTIEGASVGSEEENSGAEEAPPSQGESEESSEE